jgi:type II secretory pathway pseudopilin PulG
MNKGLFAIFTVKIKKSTSGFTHGFTVIELMVSLGIMITLLTVVTINYPESTIRLNLAILTHETSLAIREAQLRGTAVDSKDLSIGGYGIYFDDTSSSTYVSFADIATETGPNGLPIGSDETVSTTTYKTLFRFNKLCIGKGYPFDATNNGSCSGDAVSGYPVINTLTINFTRPKPRPIITINQNDPAFNPVTMSNLPGACIELVNQKKLGAGNIRSVQVYLSGRIMTLNQGCQ